ncbi:MAG: hypothetical protein ACPG7F_02590 [Aggregatilineales bacterium]
MKIRRHIRNYIIERLAPHVGPGHRESFLFDALYGTTIPDRIEWSGNNRVFAARIVDACLTYGVDEESGKHSLILVIETLKIQVGHDKKVELDGVMNTIRQRVSEGRPALEDTAPTRPLLLDAIVKKRQVKKPRQTKKTIPPTDPSPVTEIVTELATDLTPPSSVFISKIPQPDPAEDTVQNPSRLLPDDDTLPKRDENTHINSVVHANTAYDGSIIKLSSYVPPTYDSKTPPSHESSTEDTLMTKATRTGKKRASRKTLSSLTGVSALITIFLLVFFSNLAAPVTVGHCDVIDCNTPATAVVIPDVSPVVLESNTVAPTATPQQSDEVSIDIALATETIPAATATRHPSDESTCQNGIDAMLNTQTVPCFFGTVGVSLASHPTLMLLADDHARYLANLSQHSIENTSVYRFESGNPLEAELSRLAYRIETPPKMVVLASGEALSYTELFAEIRRKDLDLTAAYRVYGFAHVVSLNGRHNIVLIVGGGV